MTQEENKELQKKWNKLENDIIEEISKSDNEKLMDMFLDWMDIRNKLNEDWLKFWSDIIEKTQAKNLHKPIVSGNEVLRVALPSDEELHKEAEKYFRSKGDNELQDLAYNVGLVQGMKILMNKIKRGNDYPLLSAVKFFSFGTLQKPEIQIALFGKEINGTVDSISGWKVLNDLLIEGINYPRLVKQKTGIVFGKIFELTREQISILDEYETEAYYRDKIKTDNGIFVDVYFKSVGKKI